MDILQHFLKKESFFSIFPHESEVIETLKIVCLVVKSSGSEPDSTS